MDWQEGDRRHFSRVEFDCDALLLQNGVEHPVQLLDISVKGIHVKLHDQVAGDAVKDAPAELVVELADGAAIQMQVVPVHRREREIGFRCSSIDIESAAHLRRLVELNLNTPGAAEQVLEELLVPPRTQ